MIKNRLDYLVIVVLAGWLMIMYQTFYTVSIFGMLLAFPLITGIMLSIAVRKIDIGVSVIQKNYHKNEHIIIRITIKKTGAVPVLNGRLEIEIQNSIEQVKTKEKLNISAPGNNTVTLDYKVKTCNTGIMEINIFEIIFFDFIGIWRVKYKIGQKLNANVIPTVIEINTEENLDELRDNDWSSDLSDDIGIGNDVSIIHDIRPLREDDSIRKIHWNLSSKKDELIVKEFGRTLGRKPLIFCEPVFNNVNYKTELEDVDSVYDMTVSISHLLFENSICHNVGFISGEGGETQCLMIDNEDTYYKLPMDIIKGDVNGIIPQGIWNFNEEYAMEPYNYLIYISNIFDTELIKNISSLNTNVKCIFLLVGKNIDKDTCEKFGKEWGVDVRCPQNIKEQN